MSDNQADRIAALERDVAELKAGRFFAAVEAVASQVGKPVPVHPTPLKRVHDWPNSLAAAWIEICKLSMSPEQHDLIYNNLAIAAKMINTARKREAIQPAPPPGDNDSWCGPTPCNANGPLWPAPPKDDGIEERALAFMRSHDAKAWGPSVKDIADFARSELARQ